MSAGAGCSNLFHEMKRDQIDPGPGPMLRDSQKIHDAGKTRRSRQVGCDVSPVDLPNGIDDDIPVFKRVAAADFDARSLPNSDAGCHLSRLDQLAQWLDELQLSRSPLRP